MLLGDRGHGHLGLEARRVSQKSIYLSQSMVMLHSGRSGGSSRSPVARSLG
jgi:hypothetical protein